MQVHPPYSPHVNPPTRPHMFTHPQTTQKSIHPPKLTYQPVHLQVNPPTKQPISSPTLQTACESTQPPDCPQVNQPTRMSTSLPTHNALKSTYQPKGPLVPHPSDCLQVKPPNRLSLVQPLTTIPPASQATHQTACKITHHPKVNPTTN